MSESTADYSTHLTEAPESLPLEARIEALLFVSAAPLPLQRLCETTGASPAAVEAALANLGPQLAGHGLQLQKHRGGYSLTTSPAAADDVARLLDLESTVHLTRAALETLSIVAYRQPVTRPLVDSIRGVNSEASLHTLVRYGLVEEAGRSEGPGRPILYITTEDFLHHFGLASLAALPPIESEAPEPLDGPEPDTQP
ncbi:MAG TPA: SMC-Scp complex subunit ScpB [Anaerolineales bacterium]|nr:SMC-Scp complex subunit ScpB [Anaerolineales bacterium]